MKVLFVNYAITIGGATLALKELLIELKNNGIEPVVCTSKKDDFNTFLDDNRIENIVDGHREVMETKPKNKVKKIVKYLLHKPLYCIANYRALRKIEKSINLQEIDVIHSNSVRSDLGCLIHRKYQIPHVMHIREFSIEHFGCMIYRKGYYDYLNVNCDTILAISDAIRLAWISHGVDSNKIRTLYDGVDLGSFRIRRRNTHVNDDLRMVMVGAVYEEKGQHIAIEAINKLSEEIKKHVYLDIIGWRNQTRYGKYLDRLIDEFGLSDRVRFLGAKDNISSILAEYDIGLMCSKAEGFGRVIVEYMYSGLCVIAADTGATLEIVNDKVNGLIYQRNDAVNLSNLISILYTERDLIDLYGRKAREDTKDRFTSKRNASEVIEIYNTLCG